MRYKATITLSCTHFNSNNPSSAYLERVLREQFIHAFDKGFLFSVDELDTMTIDKIVRLVDEPQTTE